MALLVDKNLMPLALSIVAEFIASENLAYNADTVKLATTFPRYVELASILSSAL